MRSINTYVVFEGHNGEPRIHWQRGGKATVPGARDTLNYVYAPDPRWLVTAYSAKQAAFVVHHSETTASRGNGVGIWWDRAEHALPMPYGASDETWYAAERLCDAPDMVLFETAEEAEAYLDHACGGHCWLDHRVVPMRKAEAEKCGRTRYACWSLSAKAQEAEEAGR